MLNKWGWRGGCRTGSYWPPLAKAAQQTLEAKTDERDWAHVRDAYENSDETVRNIAERFGTTAPTIYRRIEAEGWRTRRPRGMLAQRRLLLGRLSTVVTREIASLEEAMDASPASVSLSDSERMTKIASGLVKLMDTISTLEAETEQLARKARAQAGRTHDDDNALRKSLAKRVAQLCRQFADAGGSGGSESR